MKQCPGCTLPNPDDAQECARCKRSLTGVPGIAGGGWKMMSGDDQDAMDSLVKAAWLGAKSLAVLAALAVASFIISLGAWLYVAFFNR